MNNLKPEESYCESEFDIYQEYNSNSGSLKSISMSHSNDPANSQNNKRKSKYLSQLFERPSLAIKMERENRKKSTTKKEVHRFKKQIESSFVHK